MNPGFWTEDRPVLMGFSGSVPEDIPGLVCFKTSGSTGEPKWIGLSRKALIISAAAVNEHLEVSSASCWILTLPLHHVGGFGVVARTYQAGCRMEHFADKWHAENFARWLADTGGTHLSLVSTQVHDLVAAGAKAPASLKAIVVGGGRLSEHVGRAARDLGWPVLASYGMTEACSQIATQSLELLGQPYVSRPIKLLSCWDVAADVDGNLMISGPALFSGTLRTHGGEWKYEERRGKWFTSSDLGKVEGRQLWIGGRADTFVKILGELVDPVVVENELLTIAAAAPGSAVVVAIPDERAGNKLVLIHENLTPSSFWEEVIRRYHESCEGYRRIASIKGIASIPKSELGKPQRALLSRFAEQGSI